VRTSACGTEPDDIAKYLGVSEQTLQKYYGKDIFRARVEANAQVGKTLYEMASGGGEPAATIFWTKTRCGFHENKSVEARPAVVPNFVVTLEIYAKFLPEYRASYREGYWCERFRNPNPGSAFARTFGERRLPFPHQPVMWDGSIDWFLENRRNATRAQERILRFGSNPAVLNFDF
jgi:hypothetical protein